MHPKETIKSQSSSNKSPKDEQLSTQQLKHLIRLIRERYISPYKIMYMINQQDADLFKKRNLSCGCCTSSSITIPKDQMTRSELFLAQAIQQCLKLSNLDKILAELSEKYNNIVKSGQKANLKVDDKVEKFIVEKTLSQGFNLHLYQVVMERLKKQAQNVANSAMLWATPQTWYSRYPNTPLNFLSAKTFSNLTNESKGFASQGSFLHDYKENLFKELTLLQKDGRFEELMWSKEHQKIRNDLKIMKDPQNFAFDGTQQSYHEGQLIYPNLKKSLLSLRSIPFELNQKLNAFCTLSQNNQITFFKDSLIYKMKGQSNFCKFSTFCIIGSDTIRCKTLSKKNADSVQQKTLKSGELLIIDPNLCQVELQGKGDSIFLFRSWISTLQKKQ